MSRTHIYLQCTDKICYCNYPNLSLLGKLWFNVRKFISKNMKKIIIFVSVLGLLIASVSYAKAKLDLTYRVADEKNGQIYGSVLDSNGIRLLKVIDGVNTCYISFIEVNNKPVDTGISCIK